jgi:hypothetical protein
MKLKNFWRPWPLRRHRSDRRIADTSQVRSGREIVNRASFARRVPICAIKAVSGTLIFDLSYDRSVDGRFAADAHDRKWPVADVGEVHFDVCFEGVKRRSSRSVVTSAYDLRVQPVSATPLEVYRLAFRSPKSFAVAD